MYVVMDVENVVTDDRNGENVVTDVRKRRDS
jgi:hypothetical protein